ncbi:endonuclease/exonuclease/phosphatase family protein [Acidisphaera sp. L21]|uniref:endonuclease/exonuclease/phosphatase family protein n=1 Tax=Acidisphaera sp. L21 TaxID=1641851 RepID=UPI0020B13F39|nr:endonuclease/exonuclease/phosphatase family protein [Acidisphaera sp. L21]
MTKHLALLLATLLPLAPIARAADLKVATWNLEWLTPRPLGDLALPEDVRPKSAADRALLRGYAQKLDADVIAVEEVDGPAIAATIFPPDRYALYFTQDDVVQRVGIAVRRGIPVHQNPDLAALDVTPNATHRLRSGADLTVDLPSGPIRLLALHLKTGCNRDQLDRSRRPQCATLRSQTAVLQGWIAQRRREGIPFVILGDFNRWMDPADQFLAALQETAPLARATEGHDSPCWGGERFIDHILAGGAARAWMDPASLRVLVYREAPDQKEHLSDHCPVSVRFHLPG